MGYDAGRWTLEGLLPDEARGFEDMESAAGELEALRPALKPDIPDETFLSALRALERLAGAMHRLQGYAHLRFAEDTRNQEALALMGRVERAAAEAQNRTLFFDLWWKLLDEATAERLMEAAGPGRYYLHVQRLFRRHTLGEAEEKVVNLKDVNGIGALGRVYEMITNKFVFDLVVDGERKSLTRDALAEYVRHPLAEVREAAYREQFRVYGDEATVLGQIYLHRAQDWAAENLTLRGFASPIAVRNLSNDVPDAVVDTLLEVCRAEAPVFHEYFRYKAALLGPEGGRLRRFDLYAPAPGRTEARIPFEQGSAMALESFNRFSPQAAGLARRMLDERRVDAEVRHGKRGGAFCMSVLPGMTPWVLCNYTGEPRQVATLAHELGHGIHSLLAGGHSVLTFHPSLPMAETASVFAEMLLTDLMLERVDDPAGRRDLLMGLLDDIYATVLRQAYFVLFEREAHEMARQGCTVDGLSARYLELLKEQFGDSVNVDDVFGLEWVGIPHILHTPFYCYAYSFGQLLSLSLYNRYREEGAGFAPRLLRILSYGGSASPGAILSEAGVDIADPAFWRSGFRAIEALVAELKGLGRAAGAGA